MITRKTAIRSVLAVVLVAGVLLGAWISGYDYDKRGPEALTVFILCAWVFSAD